MSGQADHPTTPTAAKNTPAPGEKLKFTPRTSTRPRSTTPAAALTPAKKLKPSPIPAPLTPTGQEPNPNPVPMDSTQTTTSAHQSGPLPEANPPAADQLASDDTVMKDSTLDLPVTLPSAKKKPRPHRAQPYSSRARDPTHSPSQAGTALKVYNVIARHPTMSAVEAITHIMNPEINAGLTHTNGAFINPTYFFFSLGDPSVSALAIQSAAKIQFRETAWRDGIASMDAMEMVKERLQALGYEVNWIQGNSKDHSLTLTYKFTFRPVPGEPHVINSLSEAEADSFTSHLASFLSCPIEGTWGKFGSDPATRSSTLIRWVKFLLPSDARSFHSRNRTNMSDFPGYTITCTPSSYIPIDYPTTIAACRAAGIDTDALYGEVTILVDDFNSENKLEGENAEYLISDGELLLDNYFVISCSSAALADYICKQEAIPLGQVTPFEYATVLNDRNLAAPYTKSSTRQLGEIQSGITAGGQELAKVHKQLAISEARFDKMEQGLLSMGQALIDQGATAQHNLFTMISANAADRSMFTQRTEQTESRLMLKVALRDLERDFEKAKNDVEDYEGDHSEQGKRAHARAIRSVNQLSARIKEAKEEIAQHTAVILQLDSTMPWSNLNVTTQGRLEIAAPPPNPGAPSIGHICQSSALPSLLLACAIESSSPAERRLDMDPDIPQPPYILFLLLVCTCIGTSQTHRHHRLGTILLLLCMLPVVTAAPPLHILTLNVNNMGRNWDKNEGLLNIIQTTMPHIVVLTETWQPSDERVHLPHTRGAYNNVTIQRQYNVHFVPAYGSISNGVTMLVHKTISVDKIPPITTGWGAGRVLAVDITLRGILNHHLTVRVIGIYAPTSVVRGNANIHGFWDAVRTVTDCSHDWILAGDFNTTLDDSETIGQTQSYISGRDYQLKRRLYKTFLTDLRAHDAWQEKPHLNATWDWTAHAHSDIHSKSILDRVATSHRLLVDSIRADPGIMRTNHRAVHAKLILGAFPPNARAPMLNLAPPRFRQPRAAKAKMTFDSLRTHMDRMMEVNPPPAKPETDEACDAVYASCTDIITQAANLTFYKPAADRANRALYSPPTSAACEALLTRVRTLGKLITATRESRTPRFLASHPRAARELEDIRRDHDMTHKLSILRQRRQRLAKDLIQARRKATLADQNLRTARDFSNALAGGRVKHLFEPHEISNPPALMKPQEQPGRPSYAFAPQEKLTVFTDHFRGKFTTAAVPEVAKPWLTSTASYLKQQATAGDNRLVWPAPMTLDTFRSQLARGNRIPSPGPDGWEKWILRQCTERFQELALSVVNYTIMTNYHPPDLKANYVSPLFKQKGSVVSAANYRGNVYANCLYGLTGSYFARVLQEYAWKHGLIPSTQVATQQGVQSGDLLALLNQAHYAAKLNGQTIYAIKRDHVSGFDNLHASAFYDAVHFYGLPSSVAEFDRARTTQVRMVIKSQDGISKDSIITNELVTQGNGVSPIKYNLSMGMVTHWLMSDGVSKDMIPDIRSHKADSRGAPHVPSLDGARIRLLSVEAMDDSIWMAKSWSDLSMIVNKTELFQSAYNIQTHWDSPDKTVCFTLGYPDKKRPVSVRIQTPEGVKMVPFTENPSMLRTQLHDQQATLTQILNIVRDFNIPINKSIPLSLLRKAAWTMLAPKIRGRLQYQPLMPQQACQVDDAIARKIFNIIDCSYVKAPLLTLPIKHHGFGFPSVDAINGELAISALIRGLNHHLPTFQAMARITLANASCLAGSCCNPLETTKLAGKLEDIVPPEWIAGREYLRSQGMTLVDTDRSDWRNFNSQHVMNQINHLQDTPLDSNTKRIMASNSQSLQYGTHTWEQLRSKVRSTLTDPIQTDTTRAAAADIAKRLAKRLPRAISAVSIDAFTPKVKRRQAYQRILLTPPSGTEPPVIPLDGNQALWAIDGSHKDTAPGLPSTTSAIVGPTTRAFKLTGQHSSSLHGELLAQIAVHTVSSGLGLNEGTVLTDHLGGLNIVRSTRDASTSEPLGRYYPAHELRSWLMAAARRTALQVQHVKAHTGADDINSRLNDAADTEAKRAHHGGNVTYLPPLTGWMRRFVPHLPFPGYVPDNWRTHLARLRTDKIYASLTTASRQRMGNYMPGNQPQPIPHHFYTRAPTGYTAKAQLILRSGMFRSGELRHKMVPTLPIDCPCGHPVESTHHIFVECNRYNSVREESARRFKRLALRGRRDAPPTADRQGQDELASAINEYTERILRGTQAEPTRFYYGTVPPPPLPLHPNTAYSAHNFAIILTSRILGAYLRDREEKDGRREWQRKRGRTDDENESEVANKRQRTQVVRESGKRKRTEEPSMSMKRARR